MTALSELSESWLATELESCSALLELGGQDAEAEFLTQAAAQLRDGTVSWSTALGLASWILTRLRYHDPDNSELAHWLVLLGRYLQQIQKARRAGYGH